MTSLDERLVAQLRGLQDGFGPSVVRETLARMRDDGTVCAADVLGRVREWRVLLPDGRDLPIGGTDGIGIAGLDQMTPTELAAVADRICPGSTVQTCDVTTTRSPWRNTTQGDCQWHDVMATPANTEGDHT